MTTITDLTRAAETEWLGLWPAGPVESEAMGPSAVGAAPDLKLLDHSGTPRQLSQFWVAAFRELHGLARTILCDPDHTQHRAYGLGLAGRAGAVRRAGR
jgi:hypothetical protein